MSSIDWVLKQRDGVAYVVVDDAVQQDLWWSWEAMTTVATWETVCELLGALPGTEQGLLHDNPAVRVRGKLVAYLPNNSRSRPAHAADHEEFLVVRTDFAERAALLAEDPETFFVTPHYQSYPGVIVRLATVRPDQLRELLTEAWRLVAPKRLVRGLDKA